MGTYFVVGLHMFGGIPLASWISSMDTTVRKRYIHSTNRSRARNHALLTSTSLESIWYFDNNSRLTEFTYTRLFCCYNAVVRLFLSLYTTMTRTVLFTNNDNTIHWRLYTRQSSFVYWHVTNAARRPLSMTDVTTKRWWPQKGRDNIAPARMQTVSKYRHKRGP